VPQDEVDVQESVEVVDVSPHKHEFEQGLDEYHEPGQHNIMVDHDKDRLTVHQLCTQNEVRHRNQAFPIQNKV
jgi:hypothetical protein